MMKNKERRNLFMRVGAVLIVICMIAALALPALAADTSEDTPADTSADTSSDATYSYTVRIFPGDKGTIDGKKDPIVTVVEPGYEWSGSDFDYGQRAASDTDKYYVRGIREAGRDNNTTNNLINPSFIVDRDIDLVVAYGVKGSDVTYKINYLEYGSNKKLLEPQTYHGNIGDKPVVAYLYIDGYVPQYKNVTGTLDADSTKNEWTFYYIDADDASVAVNSKYTKTGSAASKSKDNKSGVNTASVSSSNGSGTSTASSSSNGSGTSTASSSTGTAAAANSRASTASGTSTGTGTSTSSGTPADSNASTSNGTSAGSNASTSNGTSAGTSTSTESTSAAGSTASAGTTANSGSPISVGQGTMLASNGAVNTLQNGPVEIVDVDEAETPLVEYDSADQSAVEENADELLNRETEGVVRAPGMSGSAKVVIGVVVVMAIAAAGWFFFRKLNAGDDE